MGIIFFEGFETIGTEIGNANRSTVVPRLNQRYPAAQGVSSGDDPRGYLQDDSEAEGFCWRTADSGGNACKIRFIYPQSVQDIISMQGEQSGQTPKIHIVGFRLHVRSVSQTMTLWSHAYKSNSGVDTFSHINVLNLHIVNSTDLLLRRGGTTLATATAALTPGQWHYIELKFRISDTGGAQTTDGLGIVNVDGTEVINFTGDTDADLFTNSTSRDYVGFSFEFSLGSSSDASDYWALDDLYALFPEGESAPYDDFLGPVRVIRFSLDGDNSPLEWTPSTGSDHFSLVDENGADATDYVESDTDAQVDTFTLTDFGGGGTIYALKAEVEAINTVGGTPNLILGIDGTTITNVVDDTVNYDVFPVYKDAAGFDSSEVSIQFDNGF